MNRANGEYSASEYGRGYESGFAAQLPELSRVIVYTAPLDSVIDYIRSATRSLDEQLSSQLIEDDEEFQTKLALQSEELSNEVGVNGLLETDEIIVVTGRDHIKSKESDVTLELGAGMIVRGQFIKIILEGKMHENIEPYILLHRISVAHDEAVTIYDDERAVLVPTDGLCLKLGRIAVFIPSDDSQCSGVRG